MKVYYSAKLDTEAGKRACEYFANASKNRASLCALMRDHGHEIERIYSSNAQGEVMAFELKGGKPAEGWVYPRGSLGYFPKRIKKNMPLIKEIAQLRLAGNGGCCKAIFGRSPLIFRGLALIQGVAGGIFGDRAVVIFQDEEHADELRGYTGVRWPKGLRKIKASSYYALKEAEDRAAKHQAEEDTDRGHRPRTTRPITPADPVRDITKRAPRIRKCQECGRALPSIYIMPICDNCMEDMQIRDEFEEEW